MATLVTGVPDTRAINGKPLSSDVTLSASDVGAEPSGTSYAEVHQHEAKAGAHSIAGVSGLQSALDGKEAAGAAAYAVAAHKSGADQHPISGVIGLQPALDSKQSASLALAAVSDGSIGAFSHRNKLINGNFRVNQRGYVSGAVTVAGQYTLDRWRVSGAGGVAFATNNGKTTVTIPAGQTLAQVIEGANLPAGSYVLSWGGTAQGRINSGAYGSSGAVKATITGGVDVAIEFSAGTLELPQLETGPIATQFEHRPYGYELQLCKRYYQEFRYAIRAVAGLIYSGAPLPVEMRKSPTVTEISVGPNETTAITSKAISPTSTSLAVNLVVTPSTSNPAYGVTYALDAEI